MGISGGIAAAAAGAAVSSAMSDKGGGGGGAEAVDTTPPEFAALRPVISSILFKLLGQGAAPGENGLPTFQGNTVAQLRPEEQAILQRIAGAGAAPNAGTQAAQGLVTDTLGGKFLQPGSNPFLAGAIDAAIRPVREQFERQTLPNLKSQFTAAGQLVQPQGSSPFDTALGNAQNDFLQTVADISTKMSSTNFEAERTRQQAAVNQQLQLNQGELDNLVKGLQATALPRLIEQKGLDVGLQQFNRNIDLFMQALQLAQGGAMGQTVVLPGAPAGQGLDIGGLLQGGAALATALA